MLNNGNILTFENTASKEEIYFYWYLLELAEFGVIKDFNYQPEKIELVSDIRHSYIHQGKQPVKKDFLWLRKLAYTPDFYIVWNKPYEGIFYALLSSDMDLRRYAFSAKENSLGEHYSWVDVKGNFSGKHNNSAITFPIIQKILWKIKGEYVQKIVPVTKREDKRRKSESKTTFTGLFPKTFTPERFCRTDKNTQERKVVSHSDYPLVLINDFILNKFD